MRPIVTDVPWSPCVSDITISCVKTAEPIEMPYEVLTRVGLRYHVLGGSPDSQGRGNFGALPVMQLFVKIL